MNKSCIIFACTILSTDRLFVLQQFLDSFKVHFNDADIYVGINTGTIPTAIKMLETSNLNIKCINQSPPELYTKSDASAYQAALLGLRVSTEQYSKYWFIHTKGSVNSHSDYLRQWYLDNFISDRKSIELHLNNTGDGSYGKLGLGYSYGKTYTETDTEIPLFNNIITEDLPYTHASFFYIHTLYTINNIPMHKFMELITDKWFVSKLDRYYFEGVFPFIVSRTGHYPYIENKIDCSGNDLQPAMENWLLTNKLKHKINYKTNFNFNQLNPPHVNSNS
tara:strand:+ start:4329 stop:5162 length:834 start_codon:yes stop_codon:yes gene_type:complete